MKIKLPAIELKYALTGLCKVIPRKASLPILAAIRIETNQNTVRLTVTDLECTVTYTCLSLVVNKSGQVILDAKKLKEAVARPSEDEVFIEVTGTNAEEVTLKGPRGDRQHLLTPLDAKDWPSAPPDVPTKAAEVHFTELFRRLTPFASTDETRAVLNGVCIDAAKEKHTLVATDGRRLSFVNSLKLPVKETCIVPTNKFLAWPKLEGGCAIGFANGHFRLECGPWNFTCKTIEGAFPNWRQVVPSTDGRNGLDLVEEDLPSLEDAVRNLPVSEADTKAICLVPNGKAARLAVRDSEADRWCNRDLPNSRFDGQGIAVNRSYLQEAVKAGFRSFRWENAESPLVAKTVNAVHVVMPVRAPLPPTRITNNLKPKIAKENPMPRTKTNDNGSHPATGSEDQLWLCYQQVKEKARELNAAVSKLGNQIKESRRQDKALKSELSSARGVLNKLQSIKI